MISKLPRIVRLSLAGACIALLAGCETHRPKTAAAEKPEPVQPAPTPEPVTITTNQFPEPISRPRPPADAADNMASNILSWDAVEKVYYAKPGETNAPFAFALTNVSPERVMIFDTSTTCDCTVAQLPSKPWSLQPGASGELRAFLDLRGKTGDATTNYVIVFTSKGNRLLTVRAFLPKR